MEQSYLNILNIPQTLLLCVSILFVGSTCYNWYLQAKTDRDLEHTRKCKLPPALPYRWPLGIDRIKELWQSNANGRLLAFICSIADDYEPGNNLYQNLLFGPKMFHVMCPPNVEAVLSTNFKEWGFGHRPAIFAPLLGNGIFTQEGVAWKHSRELLRKQFVRAQYQNLQLFHEHVDNLIARIGSGGIVDLQPLFFDLTMDAATAILFGRSVYSLRANVDQNKKNRDFAENFNIAQEGLAKRFRLQPFHSLYNPPSFRKACQEVHRFVEEYICENRLKDGERGDESHSWFFDQMAAGSDSSKDLRDQLLNVLLAGRDTTACCLSWTVRLLVRHPAAMQRVREEITSILGERSDITREDIRRMTFLSCVVKESLRLYPPVPMNTREATQSTILPTGGGPDGTSPVLVRKGQIVTFSPYVNSRRKNLFGADADHFRPERWETGELDEIGWGYYPFNGGPRQCLGEDFALMEVKYTLIRLLQTYSHVRLPDGEKVEDVGSEKQRLTLVLSCQDGCRVHLRR